MKRTSTKTKETNNRDILNDVVPEVDTSAADDAATKALETLSRDDTHMTKVAPVFDALTAFGTGLDLSNVRARFAQYGDTIADALTDFVGTSAIENVALPICRLRALGRIANDADAVKRIGELKTPDGKGTYGNSKSPVNRFLMDVLELSKQQVAAYMRVLRECVDKSTNELKPEFRGFSFTQLDILSASKAPSENAASVDPELSMRDFRGAVAKLDTIRATTTANISGQPDGQPAESATSGQPDEQPTESATSGQPDEQPAESATSGQPDAKAADNLTTFVIGNIPEGNQFNFSPICKPDGKPVVIRAVNLTSAVNLFTDTTDDENRLMFRLPKSVEKAIVDKLPASFTGYNVKAIVADIKGYFGRASLYALCTVQTIGTDESAETTKQAAKRVETARVVLANWLTGAAQLQGIPAAVDTVNAMEIFRKAYEMVQNIPRLSGQSALAELVKGGDFQIDPNKDVDGNGNSDADIANQQSAEYAANGTH